LVTDRCKNVEIRYHASVTGMELDSRQRVCAVTVRKGDTTSRAECTLLVDATGPALAGRKWLPKVGFTSPNKIMYDPGVYYCSRKSLSHLMTSGANFGIQPFSI
jgi:hypothetical protein